MRWLVILLVGCGQQFPQTLKPQYSRWDAALERLDGALGCAWFVREGGEIRTPNEVMFVSDYIVPEVAAVGATIGGEFDPKTYEIRISSALEGSTIELVLTHELGHDLGLRYPHNVSDPVHDDAPGAVMDLVVQSDGYTDDAFAEFVDAVNEQGLNPCH